MPVRVFDSRINQLFHAPDGPTGTRLYQLGVRVQNAARQRAPVDTGRLRSSIATTRPEARGDRTLVVRIGSNVRYAIFVHEGTRYMRARPFLREAINEVMS